MRADDPVILKRIREIEQACEGLRMACGFPPRFQTPETTASRAPKWCRYCSSGFDSIPDLQHHVQAEHPGRNT